MDDGTGFLRSVKWDFWCVGGRAQTFCAEQVSTCWMEKADVNTADGNPNRAGRVAIWWIVETLLLCVCSGLLVALVSHRLYAGIAALVVVWFAFTQMHAGIELESRALNGATSRELYGQRKRLLLRLLVFYFVFLSFGVGSIFWMLGPAAEKSAEIAPVATGLGLVVIRVLCLQRRYLRLRSEELSTEW